MTNDIVVPTNTEAEVIESVVIGGDLSKLTPTQRVFYYRQVCQSMGLNYLTRPFDYIVLNGKLTLYARKDCADQLRKIHSVSIGKPDIQFQDDLIIVTVDGHDKTGRGDSEVGVVKKTSMNGDVSNAIMKAVTKAKRRLTLSICGLGWLDETEVETIPEARIVTVDPELQDGGHKPEPVTVAEPPELPQPSSEIDITTAMALTTTKGTPLSKMTYDQLNLYLADLDKAIKNNHLTPEQREDKLYRKDCVLTVMHDLKSQPA